jgi:hypothetical protein
MLRAILSCNNVTVMNLPLLEPFAAESVPFCGSSLAGNLTYYIAELDSSLQAL